MPPTNTTEIKIDPYSSSSGAGTLSYYANKYGTTVDNLLKLNPTITNKNNIASGGNLVVPTMSAPSVVTSTTARDAVNKAEDYLSGQNLSTSYINNPVQNNQQQPVASTQTATPNQYGDLVSNDQISQINNTYSAQEQSIRSSIQSMVAGLDSDTASLVAELERKYSNRIEEQRQLNAKYLGAQTTAGIASGRARYASEIQDNILSKEEQDGLKRISDLEAERDNLILQARNAKTEKQRGLLVELQNQIQEINKAKATEVKNLFDTAMSVERLGIDKAQESRNAIKDSITISQKTAESIAGAVIDQIDVSGMTKEEKANIISNYAESYGISEEYLNTAIKNYRMELSKANPAIVQEYEYMRDNSGYKGSLLDYQRAKKAANTIVSRVSSGGGSSSAKGVFTFQDAQNLDLPEELIGRSDYDVALDLTYSNPPAWFQKSQVRAGHVQPGDSEGLRAQWNVFRNSDDMLVFKQAMKAPKVTSSAASTNSSSSTSTATNYSAFSPKK